MGKTANKFLSCIFLILWISPTFLFASKEIFPDLSSIKDKNYVYDSETLNNLFCYTALKQYKSDLCFIKSVKSPISLGQKSINFDTALSLIDQNELFILTLTGEQISSINKIFKDGNWAKDLFLFGLNNNKIAYHTIENRASYKVIISEPALKEIFGLSKCGYLDQQVAVRANFIEGVYGKITNLYFIGGAKNIKLAFENNLNLVSIGTWKDILQKSSILITDIKQALSEKQVGSNHQVLLDITYLDLGFSHNTGNQAYKSHQKNQEFPISRGDVPLIGQMLINSDIGLKYYFEKFSISLENQLIYLQGNLNEKPLKDKFLSSFNTKWQFDETYSLVFNNSYETKFASLIFKDPKMYKKMSVFDHGVGLGISLPTIGIGLEIGGVLVNDLLMNNWHSALDAGPYFNINGKW